MALLRDEVNKVFGAAGMVAPEVPDEANLEVGCSDHEQTTWAKLDYLLSKVDQFEHATDSSIFDDIDNAIMDAMNKCDPCQSVEITDDDGEIDIG